MLPGWPQIYFFLCNLIFIGIKMFVIKFWFVFRVLIRLFLFYIGGKRKIISIIVFLQDIVEKVQPLSPRALIIDSIQTVYLRGVAGSAGGLMQVGFLHA